MTIRNLATRQRMAKCFKEAVQHRAAKAHPEATAIKVEYTPGQRDF